MTTQGKQGAEAGTEELRQEVDRARHDLGETVEQLAAKADVKAMARQKAAEARTRMRESAASAREVTAWAKGAGASQQAKRGGVAVAAAGGVALAAVWMRWRRSPRARLRPGRGRGRNAPVRVVFRTGQKRAVRVRRRRRRIL
ncbi:DUF3618 domain-containing protein [Spirillospora sp. NPDC048819]|uniref:DUF3618 domain-containing protein n=1 Tax=Spirillospora sp. NPDC048819 TaxID=3155268 RepID=UPI0033E5ADD8